MQNVFDICIGEDNRSPLADNPILVLSEMLEDVDFIYQFLMYVFRRKKSIFATFNRR